MSAEDEEICLQLPGQHPPGNAVSNFDNPPNDNRLVIGVIAACLGLATLFCAIRVYSKLFCVRRILFEDVLGLLGYGFIIAACCTLGAIFNDIGFFVHNWNVRLGNMGGFIHVRLFHHDHHVLRVPHAVQDGHPHRVDTLLRAPGRAQLLLLDLHVLIWINIGLYVAIIVAINFTCDPPAKRLRPWLPGHCINVEALGLVASCFNLLLNLFILLLPHKVIWNLKLSQQQKAGVSFIFSIGITTTVCAAGRIESAIDLLDNPDFTYAYSRHLVWGLAEITTAGLVFFVPSVPIAFRKPQRNAKLTTQLWPKRGSRFIPTAASSKGRAWRPVNPVNVSTGTYRRMNDTGDLPLTPMAHAHATGSPPSHHHPRHDSLDVDASPDEIPQGGGILKTTEIVTYEEPAATIPNSYFQEHLHPWLEEKR
ncbi:hypothetical protein F4778DRAFT_803052 [Xylariomycetidae sp. FL2044]|nr:hypothetical protein F4778DRAFT_803052 [Xylariomycetidae sp. FL2044]